MVAGIDTACSIAVHPITSDLYVAERKSQTFLVFPPAGDGVGGGGDKGGSTGATSWGSRLNLNFPYVPGFVGGAVNPKQTVCATIAFTEDGSSAWVSDPDNRRMIKVDVATETVLDTVMFLTSSYVSICILCIAG